MDNLESPCRSVDSNGFQRTPKESEATCQRYAKPAAPLCERINLIHLPDPTRHSRRELAVHFVPATKGATTQVFLRAKRLTALSLAFSRAAGSTCQVCPASDESAHELRHFRSSALRGDNYKHDATRSFGTQRPLDSIQRAAPSKGTVSVRRRRLRFGRSVCPRQLAPCGDSEFGRTRKATCARLAD